MILEHIAQTVAENTAKIIGVPISITDDKGTIIGCTDRSRHGTFHKVSQDVLQKNRTTYYRPEDVKKLDNVLPGVAAPIMFNRQAIGVLGIIGNPSEVDKYVQLVKSHVEMMCQQAFKKEMSELELKTTATFLQHILHHNSTDNTEHLARYGKILGYDLELVRICLLVDVKMRAIDTRFCLQLFQREVIDQLSALFKDCPQDIVSPLNVEQFIVLKSLSSRNSHGLLIDTLPSKLDAFNRFLSAKYGLAARIAVGNAQKGIHGIAESYRHTVKALKTGTKVELQANIFHYDDWKMTLELLPQELKPDIQKKLLKTAQGLIHHDNFAVLSKTFITYCESDMNFSQAARNLYIHRNTLIYRLEQIGKLVSLNLNRFEHCLLLYIALKYADFTQSEHSHSSPLPK